MTAPVQEQVASSALAVATSATVSFQQGAGGYAGAVDTNLRGANPTTVYATTTQLFADTDTAGAPAQALLRFDNMFGTGAGQIPLGAHITSASLTLQTSDLGDGAELHRMLRSWADTDTWSSLGSGVQADGTEAVVAADRVTGKMTALGSNSFDVTASLQAWSDGAANRGWPSCRPAPTAGGSVQRGQRSSQAVGHLRRGRHDARAQPGAVGCAEPGRRQQRSDRVCLHRHPLRRYQR